MKTWSLILMASLVLVASCKKQTCPTCPKTGDCPPPAVDAAGEEQAHEFVYVQHETNGNQAMVAIRPDGKAIVIPLDPKTRTIVDGKETTLGDTVMFGPGGGGCPCVQPRCWPYCRPAADVLGNTSGFYGGGTGSSTGPTGTEQGSGGAPTAPK